MDIACTSICCRGCWQDEVAATLELAPATGCRRMGIHGPTPGSIEVVERVIECVGRVLTRTEPDSPVKLIREPQLGNCLEQRDDSGRLSATPHPRSVPVAERQVGTETVNNDRELICSSLAHSSSVGERRSGSSR